MSDAQLRQVRELCLRCCVRPLGRESADVQFVDHRIAQRLRDKAQRAFLRGIQALDVHEVGGAMNPVGLPFRSRIRDRLTAVDRVSIAVGEDRVVDFDLPISRLRTSGCPRVQRDSPLRRHQFH